MKKRGKKAQQVFGMSFGVIFSIILIIFFIVIAFIAINAFLKAQKCAQIGIFIEDFQPEIDKAWNMQGAGFEFKSKLPTDLDYVCFANLSKKLDNNDIGWEIDIHSTGNLFFYPMKNACNIPNHNVNHLDIEEITKSENPYCIPVDKGVVKIQIEKGFNERFVRISR